MKIRYHHLLICIFINLFFPLKMVVASSYFHIDPLDKTLETSLLSKNIWHDGCPVTLGELRVLSVNYWDLQGRSHQGKIILHQSVADAALCVFQKLYAVHFPFSNIDTLLSFDGAWQKAEENNTTYGFICRQDKNHFAPESYGKTITINPVLNPEFSLVTISEKMTARELIGEFLKKTKQMFSESTWSNIEVLHRVRISPKSGIFAINRSLKTKGMTEAVEPIFAAQGFIRAKQTENRMTWKKFVLSKKENRTSESGSFLMDVKDKSASKSIFSYEALPQTLREKLIKEHKWHSECPVYLNRLNLLSFAYWDFNGRTKLGHIVVFDALAPYLAMAFKELYAKKFPIETPELDTNDEKDASTSGFYCRPITGTTKTFSLHSYGLAVDINVTRNPYLGAFDLDYRGDFFGLMIPFDVVSFNYLNRQQIRLGMNEGIVGIMRKYGLIEWGGNWEERMDYMHFQVPKNLAKNLVYLNLNSAKQLLALSIQYPEAAKKMSDDQRWQYLYRLYPRKYMQILSRYFSHLQSEDESQIINHVYLDLVNSYTSQ